MNITTDDVQTAWPDGLYSIKRHGATISNCDAEPIQTPGCIQANGALLALRMSDLTILHASENSEAWLGSSPENLLGASVSVVVGSEREAKLRETLEREPCENNPLYIFTVPAQDNTVTLNVIVHVADGLVILEFESNGSEKNTVIPDYYGILKKTVTRLHAATTVLSFCQQVTEEFRNLTVLDRVMVYRFHEDDHGEVVAECKRDDLPSWLGLHYPSEDVPKPARDIFMKIWIRPLANANAMPVEIVPLANPDTGRPLEMTYCALRGASMMYTEYLQNMGVAATLTMPIQKNGRLWGLIACHHYTPTLFPYQMRAACEFLAQVVSLQIKSIEDREQLAYCLKLDTIHGQLIATAAKVGDLNALTAGKPNLIDGISANGVAMYYDDRWWSVGQTPNEPQLDKLLEWLIQRPEIDSSVFATDSLSQEYPDDTALSEMASGLMAVSISLTRYALILWFRPEIIQSINWAGNPHDKPTILGPNGPRLTPRTSFELFTESVRGRSLPWKEVEIEAAKKLRIGVMELVIKRTEQLAALNADLMRSNEELDTFSYVASHDLKEPLRGITKYAHQLLENSTHLDEENRQRLEGLMRLTLRMDSLLESLLQFSRLGRVPLEFESVDVNEVVQEAMEITAVRQTETQTKLLISRPLPKVNCDRVRTREIFVNLITNAMKYNDKTIPRVEIGYWQPGEADAPPDLNKYSKQSIVFFVKDNGIGVGLTIVQMLIERQQGEIWLISKPGEGSTFYFTLGGKPK
jgi:light-regulated signal transduction histidine kinase (bacteriophytochrome)